jgi:hypothetical protein
MKPEDSTPYGIILNLAKERMNKVQGGGVVDLPKDFDDFGPYNSEQPWLDAARDVACYLGAKSLPIDVYYGFSSIEIRVFAPKF